MPVKRSATPTTRTANTAATPRNNAIGEFESPRGSRTTRLTFDVGTTRRLPWLRCSGFAVAMACASPQPMAASDGLRARESAPPTASRQPTDAGVLTPPAADGQLERSADRPADDMEPCRAPDAPCQEL